MNWLILQKLFRGYRRKIYKPENCDLTWIEIVEQKKKYFHPFGINGWPKEPPNYIAFRYNGKLQSIHHIESYTVTKSLHSAIIEMPDV